jgi:hypothetical protein
MLHKGKSSVGGISNTDLGGFRQENSTFLPASAMAMSDHGKRACKGLAPKSGI